MKKSVILAILGLSVAAVSSYGQGQVAFDTYTAKSGSGILTTYGNGLSGPIGSTFTGELLWSATAISDNATTAGTVSNPLNPAWNVGISGTFATPATVAAGYISAGNLVLSSGQIAAGATVYLEIVAFNGTGWNTGSTYQGHSASFTATVASGLTLPNGNQMNNLVPFQVFQAVPEPATMALGGLGLASLLLFRRKQA